MLSILSNKEVDNLMDAYRNPKYIKDNWILVNKNEYNKNKNKVILTSANYYLKENKIKEEGLKEYSSKQVCVNCETKNKYIVIRYNGNFIAVNICDNEYGFSINPMKLISARNINLSDPLGLKSELPSFKYVLSILGWKITKQALNNIQKQDDYF